MIPSLGRGAIAARDRRRKGPGPNRFRPPDAEPISTAALPAPVALEPLFRNGAIPEQNELPRHTHGPLSAAPPGRRLRSGSGDSSSQAPLAARQDGTRPRERGDLLRSRTTPARRPATASSLPASRLPGSGRSGARQWPGARAGLPGPFRPPRSHRDGPGRSEPAPARHHEPFQKTFFF